jgi:hypothetical protein
MGCLSGIFVSSTELTIIVPGDTSGRFGTCSAETPGKRIFRVV